MGKEIKELIVQNDINNILLYIFFKKNSSLITMAKIYLYKKIKNISKTKLTQSQKNIKKIMYKNNKKIHKNNSQFF